MSARKKILPIFIPHLGCPHACVFCNQREITGAEAERALADLKELCRADHHDAELALYGGSFTALPRDEMLGYLETAKGHFSSIRISTRPDAVSPEILQILHAYGVGTVELGAQSMRNSVLRLSGRGHTAEDVEHAADMVRSGGFHLVLQMMTGLPGDDDAGALESAKKMAALQPDAMRIYPAVVVRGTKLEQLWRRGEYREHTVEDAVRICAQIWPVLEERGIPVIRLGLNPTELLSAGGAAAGAYHPALGELVRSRVLRNRSEALLSSLDCTGAEIRLLVRPELLSQMIGQKKCNIHWLTERFQLALLQVSASSVPVGNEILIERCLRAFPV
ncbi:MAG: radical SAM protein [Oscillospiraceae bacterium]|nr:radical SAM protein [Oscillospiraceae bacterium]